MELLQINPNVFNALIYLGIGIIIFLIILVIFFVRQQKRLQKIIEGQPIRTIRMVEKKDPKNSYNTPPLGRINWWQEIILTFSNKKSLFSSKKIERSVVFITFLVITIVYLAKNIHELEGLEFIEIVALWLMYGGYNSLMNLRERRTLGGFNNFNDGFNPNAKFDPNPNEEMGEIDTPLDPNLPK
jgi:hypothetical protein